MRCSWRRRARRRLRIVSEGGIGSAYEDGALVLEYELPDGVAPVGLFIRGENGALFDDFSVRPS